MELCRPDMIAEIDDFAEKHLGIPSETLMGRSGVAAYLALKELISEGGSVLILCGGGNNGGDGYALASLLLGKYSVTVYDLFDKGQRSPCGKYFLDGFAERGGVIKKGFPTKGEIDSADCVVDAIFGTGAKKGIPEELSSLADMLSSSKAKKLAIDIPLGVSAEDGTVEDGAIPADATVVLSYYKVGMLSYPAREYLGKLSFSDLGIDREAVRKRFSFKDFLVDESLAKSLLPKRRKNSNKGSYGKALLITGSEKYEGAGRLSLEAALRSGAGIIGYVSTSALRSRLIETFPEAIYHPLLDEPKKNISKICEASKKYSSVLIGSGSDKSEELYELVSALLSEEGSPIVLDADALNSLAEYGSADEIKNSKRVVILTPHPLELSRLAKIPVGEISKNRLKIAKSFAKDNRCILLLKGAQTLVTDGELLYINSTGNTALAKGGSGDVLSGALVSLLAFCDSPLKATALAAYLHGKAGDALSMIYSEFGVTPSDLPKQLAKEIKELSNE